MNLSHLKELVRIVEDSDIDEIEISHWGQRIRVTKNRRENHAAPGDGAPAPNGARAAAVSGPVAAPIPAAPAPPAPASNESALKAPMVGTFYRAVSPDARPFVEVGDLVQPETVVCIIEAMKLMNEIQAEASGRIVAVDVENAQPVEFGQTLFRIAPA